MVAEGSPVCLLGLRLAAILGSMPETTSLLGLVLLEQDAAGTTLGETRPHEGETRGGRNSTS